MDIGLRADKFVPVLARVDDESDDVTEDSLVSSVI